MKTQLRAARKVALFVFMRFSQGYHGGTTGVSFLRCDTLLTPYPDALLFPLNKGDSLF